MAEEEKREFSETTDNEVPKGAEYDVFEENTKTFVESQEMNRDYLKHIYKEDMEFLNKDVRMTRTEYFKDVDKTNESFDKEEKFVRRLLVASIIIAIIAIVIHCRDGTMEHASKYGDGFRFAKPSDVIFQDCLLWEIQLVIHTITFVEDYINSQFSEHFH